MKTTIDRVPCAVLGDHVFSRASLADLDALRLVSRRFGALVAAVVKTHGYGAQLHADARRVTREQLRARHSGCAEASDKNIAAFVARADGAFRNEPGRAGWTKTSTARCVLMYSVRLGPAWRLRHRAMAWAIGCLSPRLHAIMWSPDPAEAVAALYPGDPHVATIVKTVKEAHVRRLQGEPREALAPLAAFVFRRALAVKGGLTGPGDAVEAALHSIRALALGLAKPGPPAPLTPHDMLSMAYAHVDVADAESDTEEIRYLRHICVIGPCKFKLLDGFPCRAAREQDARARIVRFMSVHGETTVQAYDPNTDQTREITPDEALELLTSEHPGGPGLVSEEIE